MGNAPWQPGYTTREQAIRAGKKFFSLANGTLGRHNRDFHIVANEYGRYHFAEGRPKRDAALAAPGEREEP